MNVKHQNDPTRFPVSLQLDSSCDINVAVNAKCQIGSKVGGVIKNIFDGKYLEGFVELINEAANVVFEEKDNVMKTNWKTNYGIHNGAVIRSDCLVYVRNIQKKKLVSGFQNVSLTAIAVHSADITKMTKNDFKALISQIKPEVTPEERAKLIS